MTTTKEAQSGAGLQIPQGLSLAEKVIEGIKISDTALQKAAAAEESQREKQARVSALIPQVVDTMVKYERVSEGQREKLAEMLQDPATALELIIKVAGHRNREEVSRLGSGVDVNGQTKTASANGAPGYDPATSVNDPNVGARTTRIKQSSVALFQGLGLNAPSQQQ
jgi:hypothetical protein